MSFWHQHHGLQIGMITAHAVIQVYMGHSGVRKWLADVEPLQVLDQTNASVAQDIRDGSVTVCVLPLYCWLVGWVHIQCARLVDQRVLCVKW